MQGKKVNGFTLLKQIGLGGMAEVWYAKNEIGMVAAVKILSKELSNNARMKNRFINEAKMMVQLDHPNIRKVLGFGSIDERPAIIMEYLEGSDLKVRMRRGQQFTDEELRMWWNQLVDALAFTHSQNIVHRDIKPSNIFIDQKGDAKLLDFGIAKVTDTSTGTRTGASLGTRIYMSPEQVKDPKRVGAPSDAYSLAISFVHLLSGKAPYDVQNTSDYDIQVSIVTQNIDLSGIPEEWQEMLAPYLEKDPDKRPPLKPFVMEIKPTAETNEVEADLETPTSDKEPIPEDASLKHTPFEAILKLPRLPWIVAGVACIVAILALSLGGKDNEVTINSNFKPLVCVSALKMNIVYAGIDNPIAVGGSSDLTVKAEGAQLTPTGEGTYDLRVEGRPDTVVVTVSKGDSIMGSMSFRVKDLPMPKPVIENVDANGRCTTDDLLAANGVRVELKDIDFEGLKYDVVGYTVRYRPKEKKEKNHNVKGSDFNQKLVADIEQAKVGDVFIFTEINVKGNYNKETIKLDSQISIEIK